MSGRAVLTYHRLIVDFGGVSDSASAIRLAVLSGVGRMRHVVSRRSMIVGRSTESPHCRESSPAGPPRRVTTSRPITGGRPGSGGSPANDSTSLVSEQGESALLLHAEPMTAITDRGGTRVDRWWASTLPELSDSILPAVSSATQRQVRSASRRCIHAGWEPKETKGSVE
jgi:hypothetical protein